jgi:carboxyl-terminal processing protease
MKMNTMIKSFYILAIVLGLASTAYAQTPVAAQNAQENSQKFARLLRLVESYYVDSTNIGNLTEKAITSLLQDLDPHSVYISKEEVERMNEPLQGNFEGIGISFNIHKDTLLVLSTVPGGPSEKIGILAGDRFIFIDGKNVAGIGIENEDVMKMLRGEKGTKVEIRVKRRSIAELLDFTIIRDKIPINSLEASYMIDNETGYIKLNRFAATTIEEFRTAMAGLQSQNVKNLILDLRGNGGGYLKAAIDLADEFLPGNSLVVYTEGINNPKRDYLATQEGSFEKGKLVVLMNEGSASASEIVAGAIQDWDRGVIIGRRSFGKGLVQQPFFLTDGSMVRLTTAHYYTPSGRGIQKPYENGVDDYRSDYQRRLESGEMFSADSISFPDSLKFKTLINGRTVYGGGGIMPDIFVSLDTSYLYQYYNRLQRNQIINNFSLEYLDKNRNSLTKKYPEFNQFNLKFNASDDMVETIVSTGEKEGIDRDLKSIDFTQEQMKKEIKAIIARDLFSRDNFYQVLNQDDKTIIKALELFQDQKMYQDFLVKID